MTLDMKSHNPSDREEGRFRYLLLYIMEAPRRSRTNSKYIVITTSAHGALFINSLISIKETDQHLTAEIACCDRLKINGINAFLKQGDPFYRIMVTAYRRLACRIVRSGSTLCIEISQKKEVIGHWYRILCALNLLQKIRCRVYTTIQPPLFHSSHCSPCSCATYTNSYFSFHPYQI